MLIAWDDYALNAELIRLEQANAQLLQTAVMVAEARNRAGTGGQQELLEAPTNWTFLEMTSQRCRHNSRPSGRRSMHS